MRLDMKSLIVLSVSAANAILLVRRYRETGRDLAALEVAPNLSKKPHEGSRSTIGRLSGGFTAFEDA